MKIVYEDEEILVLNKDAGVPVQAGRVTVPDLVSEVRNYLMEKTGDPYVGIVHRLDQPVEGLIVFAKTRNAAARLSAQAAGKAKGGSDMRKVYCAWVCLTDEQGRRAAEAGRKRVVTLTDFLRRDMALNKTLVCFEGDEGAKLAVLTYRTLSIDGDTATLEVHLKTGRHHQIRAQLSHTHMPIVGDTKYGGAVPDRNSAGADGQSAEEGGQSNQDMLRRDGRVNGQDGVPVRNRETGIRLCACRLSLRHPQSGRKMSFEITPSFMKKPE